MSSRKTIDQRNQMTELERLRHSCAHVLATAILRIWPEARLDIGPPTKEGFYYDFDLPNHRFSPDDFEKIEAEMKRVTKENHTFDRSIRTRSEAIEFFKKRGQDFKVERVKDIPEGEEITFFQNGEFIDLCAGPHVRRTGNIRAFTLLKVASAYYRGNEKMPQLQRIYGTAFPRKADLEKWLEAQEEARRRDHRKIGREMALFAFDDEVGQGLPLWLPKGTVLIEELEKLARETEFTAGYQRVRTPHLAKERLYKTSGHLPYYAESMFPPMELNEGKLKDGTLKNQKNAKERYYLKAMNCPHHHKIFAALPRSYRELPLRLAEYGACYRYEQSGELMGLMRVRSMQMNDAHIYCSEDQFADEFRAVNEMYLNYFRIFGFEKYHMRFSTHDPSRLGEKFVDEAKLWMKTEAMVREVLLESGIAFEEIPNEAAFYGPKIDVQIESLSGREFTIATNQVDFAIPRRFGLTYKTRDNKGAIPLCIHRAPLGTHERFIAFLIEHFAGNFPLWLAPEQVRVLSIGEAPIGFAKEIHQTLREKNVRAEIDLGHDHINGKIQNAERAKVHTMMIIGSREAAKGSVSLRAHGKGKIGEMPFQRCLNTILSSISSRNL